MGLEIQGEFIRNNGTPFREPIYADIQNTVNNIQFQKENMYSNMQDKVVYICLIFAYTGLKCITYTTYTEQTQKNYDSFVNNINCI